MFKLASEFSSFLLPSFLLALPSSLKYSLMHKKMDSLDKLCHYVGGMRFIATYFCSKLFYNKNDVIWFACMRRPSGEGVESHLNVGQWLTLRPLLVVTHRVWVSVLCLSFILPLPATSFLVDCHTESRTGWLIPHHEFKWGSAWLYHGCFWMVEWERVHSNEHRPETREAENSGGAPVVSASCFWIPQQSGEEGGDRTACGPGQWAFPGGVRILFAGLLESWVFLFLNSPFIFV